MGKKTEVLTAIFEDCLKRGSFEFDNHIVKRIAGDVGFGNPFDATKADDSSKLPEEIRKAGYFLLHLGEGGRHIFVKGIDIGYHSFEPIPESLQIQWQYRKSLLNELDTSEANILSVGSNQRILHDFLFEDIVASPKVYNARRTKASFDFWVGEQHIVTDSVQLEIDMTMEYHGDVVVFEAKNNFRPDFAVYQIFYPFLYYRQIAREKALGVKSIKACYVLREKDKSGCSMLRLYAYTFRDEERMDSIELLKCAEYRLVRR
jgi:hypothetical protein